MELINPPLSNFDVFLSNETFVSLNEEGRQKIARLLKTIRFRAGEFMMRAGERQDSGLYIVIEGQLHALVQGEDGEQVVGVIEPGSFFGEMELITGQTRQASIRAVTNGELVYLSRSDFEQIIQEYPAILHQLGEVVQRRLRRNQLAKILPSFFGPLSLAAIEEIEAQAAWIHLQRGDVLMRIGEVDGYLYIVVSGRLEARVPDQRGQEKTMTVLQMGDTVGEMQVFTDEPRSANVYAVRETELVRISRDTFAKLQATYPQMMLSITRQIIARMRRIIVRKPARATLFNLALVPLQAHLPIREFVANLANVLSEWTNPLVLSSEKVDEILISPGISQLPPGDLNEIRLLTWLDEREAAFSSVLYTADAQLTPWTLRCLLRADRVIFLGDGHTAPEEEYVREVMALLKRENIETCRELALYYPDDTPRVGTASRWLPLLEPVTRHYHVQTPADFRRMARLLTGNATGLVLGGGGARGFAHIGVLQAIHEMGVEIDLIGGTSMGSIIGGAYAAGKDHKTIYEMAKGLSTNKKMVDYTFPATSLAAGKTFTETLMNLFGETRIEDAWREYFCISANLTQAQMVVHQRGPLWKYTRASSALPLIFPPVLDGEDVLVDGVVVNNLPVDLMQQFCEGGKVIGVDVSSEEDLKGMYNFAPVLSGWQILLNRLRTPAKQIRSPKLLNITLRVAEINSVRLKRQQYEIADLMIRPDVEGFDIFRIEAIDSIVERGYAAARRALEHWG
ncbi:MAG: cyclic nucleotide-binding and patatin-like phospholipase domain-containing protein [Anaerolineales bacterium]